MIYDNFQFLWKMWYKINWSSTKNSITTGASPQKGTMSLDIFRSSKEKQRQSFFKSVENKPCQKRTLLKTSPLNIIVAITVALVERDDTGELKYIRTKTASKRF